MGVLSPAICKGSSMYWYLTQKTTPWDVYRIWHSVRGSYIYLQAQQKLTGRIHLYGFEPEDTSSADHSESSKREKELGYLITLLVIMLSRVIRFFLNIFRC